MNRKVLALAITALLAANAANAAEIYNKDGNKVNLKGTVEAAYKFRGDDKNRPEGIDNEDGTFARLGFHGETQINSQLTGYGVFEYEFTPDNRQGNFDDNDETRLAYVGLKYANFGSLDFGRNNGVVGIVRDYTDNASKFGGDGFGGGADKFMTGRASGVATYSVHDAYGYVDGLNMYLQYQAKNNEMKGSSLQDTHGDGFAFTTTYEHDLGFGVAATYANSDRTAAQRALSKDRTETKFNTDTGMMETNKIAGTGTNGNYAEIWGIAAKYDANNIYAAVSWAQSNNMFEINNEFAHRTRGLEAVAKYAFDFGLTPSIVYNQMRGRDLRQGAGYITNGTDDMYNAYMVKYVGLGAAYAFNKNMDMAVGYKINLIDEDARFTEVAGIAADDQVEMRLTYNF